RLPERAGRTGRARRSEPKHDLVPFGVELDLAALLELAEEQLVAERALHLVLDQPIERSGAEIGVVSLGCQVIEGAIGEANSDVRFGEVRFQLADEFAHDALHDRGIERSELHATVEPVSKLGAEEVLEGLIVLPHFAAITEAEPSGSKLANAHVARHDED